ncbi:hypothetical protein E2C01_044187 [Portunus trituberculatus]|uniref:Uncharacterized protein n=1 Tax=Portunus trituberculatus TaxID=210409 RepID=A0A5B7FYN7_PORTR|nr:hypothetical protein [Portunus trituberculatus]
MQGSGRNLDSSDRARATAAHRIFGSHSNPREYMSGSTTGTPGLHRTTQGQAWATQQQSNTAGTTTHLPPLASRGATVYRHASLMDRPGQQQGRRAVTCRVCRAKTVNKINVDICGRRINLLKRKVSEINGVMGLYIDETIF